MCLKKIGKALLFPHIIIMVLIVPISIVLLVGSTVFMGSRSGVAYVSYGISAYTLTVWCFKTPYLIKSFKSFKDKNKYAKKWKEDPRFRVNVSLFASLMWNALYGIFQLWLGFYHHTFWFFSIGAYYLCLVAMRFFLFLHTTKYKPQKEMQKELKKYRLSGIVLLVLNLALSMIIFFMVYWNRTFVHHMITSIAMAGYTFAALTVAIINVFRYRKYNSPVFSASKNISLASAAVSMLTLESTMLTTFSDGTITKTMQKWMLGTTGGAICLFIFSMAIYMIVSGTKKLNQLKEVKNGK